MKRLLTYSLVSLAALTAIAPALHAEEAEDKSSWRKAADNKIYAQKLVDELMSAHSELLVVGMHAIAPGQTEERMIASNLDRIGKKDDDDDVGVATEHKTICAPNLKDPNKFEVLMPLKDAQGATLNAAVGFVFKYKAGNDEVKMHALATALRDDLAKKTPSLSALFNPTE